MNRSINWSFLLITTVLGVSVGVALYLLHDRQVSRTARGLLVYAEAREKEADWPKAAEYLERYVHLKPVDKEMKARLALTYAKYAKGDNRALEEKQRGVDLLRDALRVGNKKVELDLHRELANLLLGVGRLPEAEREALEVLKQDHSDRHALSALATALSCQILDGSLDERRYKKRIDGRESDDKWEVLDTLDRARHANPDNVLLTELLARLFRNFPKLTKAERPDWNEKRCQKGADDAFNELVEKNPNRAKAYLARHNYRVEYKLPGADADLAEALRLAPDDPEIYPETLLIAARSQLLQAQQPAQRGAAARDVSAQLAQAKVHYEKLLSITSARQPPEAYLELGVTLRALNELDQALEIWKTGLQQFDRPTTQVSFQSAIADTYLQCDRLSEAHEALNLLDKLLGKLDSSVPLLQRTELSRAQELRRATLHVKRGDFVAALPLLRHVVATQAKNDASDSAWRSWMLLGSSFAALGEWREAGTAFDQASALRPTMASSKAAAANAWLQAGRADQARESAEQSLTTSPTVEAWYVLAQAQLQIQLSRPHAQRRWERFEQALAALDKARSQLGNLSPWKIDFLRVEHCLAEGRSAASPAASVQEAIKVLQRAEIEHESSKEFWQQVALIYQQIKLSDEADRASREFVSKGGTAVDALLLQTKLASLRGDDAEGLKILQEAALSLSPHDQEKLHEEQLRLTLATKDLKQARALLLLDHQRNPQNLAVLRKLAEVDLERRDLSAVEGWEGELIKAGSLGEHSARFFRAGRLYLTAQSSTAPELEEALREAEQVILAQPTWAQAASLKAMIEQRLGMLDQAAMDYERAIANGERRLLVFENLISLLDQLKRPADIDRYLSRLEVDMPLTQRLTELAVSREVVRDRPEQALDIARRNVKQRPSDGLAHLWLGRLLAVLNQPAEAESELRKATELRPNDPNTWNSLLAGYARSQNHEGVQQALASIQKLAEMSDVQKGLLVGYCRELLGNREEAGRSFAQAAAEGTNDLTVQVRAAQHFLNSDPAQARSYLEAALKVDPSSVAARRLLAIAHASLGDIAQASAVLTREDGSGATLSSEDARLNVVLLMRQGGADNLRQAMELLENLVADQSGGGQPVDRLLLAQLCEQLAGKSPDPKSSQALLQRAEEQLLKLAEKKEADPTHLAIFVQFLIRRQRAADADQWLRMLEERVENQTKTDANTLALVIQTQLLIPTQLQNGAAQRSDRWLKKLEATESQSWRPVALRAQVAVRLNEKADVESLVEPKAAELLASAKTPDDKRRLQAAVSDLYVALQRWPAAERWTRQLVSESPPAYPRLTAVLAKEGKLGEAISLCEHAAQSDPTPQAVIVLAQLLVEGRAVRRDFEQAEPILAAALLKFGQDKDLLYSAALVRTVAEQHAQAVALYRRVLAIDSRHVPSLNNLAMILGENPAQRAEALRLIDNAIEIAGEDAGLLDTKGAILVYSGRSEEAVPLLELAARDAEADPRHHFHLALAYCDQGRADAAKSQLKSALDRQLVGQILTATDQKLLVELRAAMQL